MGRSATSEKLVRGRNGGDDSEYYTQQSPVPDRTLFLSGEINEHSITQIQAMLLAYASQNSRPIYMVVSTYGGSVDEMFSLYDMIKFITCPVYTIGIGKVMSAGVLLLASGAKGKRMIGANARIMMHPLSAGAAGNLFEIENEVQEYKRQHKLSVAAIAKETNMSRADIEKIMSAGHDYYITPIEALKLGIADKIIGAHALPQK